ncbi:MAG: hypothetical protein ACFFDH_09935, partial [Promethearchaeota archaeon]
KCGYIIIEEYFIGKEIVIEGFVTDYKYHDLVIGDREYFNLPNLFIPSQTFFPSNLGIELQNKITEANKSLIDNFKPRFGITHSEFIVNEDTGEFRLVETAIRGGGVYISSDLIPLGCGVDVNDLLIDIVTGNEETVNFEDEIIQQGSGYICFYLPKGIIKSIHGVQKIRQIKEVHKIYLDDICIGQKTDNILDKTMRLGPILIKGINRLACNDTVDKIKNILNIKVETNFGTKGICWQ